MSLSVMRTPQATNPDPKHLWIPRSQQIKEVYQLLVELPGKDHPQLNTKSDSKLSWLIFRVTPLVKELLDAVTSNEDENLLLMKSKYEPGSELYYPKEICLLREKVDKKINEINDHLQKLELPMIGE